jgi:hypothetical protein
VVNCVNCDSVAKERHHIVPRSLGGSDRDSNLAWVCTECHGKIHGRDFLKSRELQKAGIERAKARGAYKGAKARIDKNKVIELFISGTSPTEISRKLNISRQSVYRIKWKEVTK